MRSDGGGLDMRIPRNGDLQTKHDNLYLKKFSFTRIPILNETYPKGFGLD